MAILHRGARDLILLLAQRVFILANRRFRAALQQKGQRKSGQSKCNQQNERRSFHGWLLAVPQAMAGSFSMCPPFALNTNRSSCAALTGALCVMAQSPPMRIPAGKLVIGRMVQSC